MKSKTDRPPSSAMKIVFDEQDFLKKLFFFLVGVEIFILWADVFLNLYQWVDTRSLRRVFNITREDSLANWFSSLQMFFVGSVVFVIYQVKRIAAEDGRNGWAVLACCFFYLAVDDAVKLHERVGTSVKPLLRTYVELYPSYPWQVVLGPLFVLMGIFILVFLWKRMAEQRRLIVLAMMIFAAAIGLDFLEGQESPIYRNIALWFSMEQPKTIHLSKALEETIEMLATSLLLVGFLRHLFDQGSSLCFDWRKKPEV